MQNKRQNMPTRAETGKAERVEKELAHLTDIFSEIDPNKRDFVQRHIEQLAWFNVSIADLQAMIDKQGTAVNYNNGGGQSGTRTNPNVKTLLDYQKCCNTIIRTLIPLVPNNITSDKLSEFLNDGLVLEDI